MRCSLQLLQGWDGDWSKGLPRTAFRSRQWLQQLDNAILVRSERELVQGSAAARSQSWQSKFSPEILASMYAKD